MVEPHTAFVAISSLISITGLWWLLFWLYPDYRLDLFRQQIFCLRHRLFEMASAGKIDFNHPAYGMLRSMMNGNIRLAHRMSLLRILLFVALIRGQPLRELASDFESHWQKVSETLNSDVRLELQDFRNRMHVIILRHVLLNSPILVLSMLTIIVPIVLWAIGRFWMKSLLARLARLFSGIDAESAAIGSPA